MSRPFLTDAEIREIVAPLTQPSAIVRWFRLNGFHAVKVRPNGMPLITRAHFDAVTGGAQQLEQSEEGSEQPDVSGYLKHLASRSKSKSAH